MGRSGFRDENVRDNAYYWVVRGTGLGERSWASSAFGLFIFGILRVCIAGSHHVVAFLAGDFSPPFFPHSPFLDTGHGSGFGYISVFMYTTFMYGRTGVEDCHCSYICRQRVGSWSERAVKVGPPPILAHGSSLHR